MPLGLHSMRKATARLIVGLVVLGAAAWAMLSFYRSEPQQKRGVEIQQAEALATILADRNQTKQSVARMVSAHNAVTDWTDAFGGDRFTEDIPLGEFVPTFIRKDRRPVLVFGSLVDVVTQGDGCKLEMDVKANLVSNMRFWLACTPAQVKEAISRRDEARQEVLEEIREEAGEREETAQEKQDNERRAERMARMGYAVIVNVDTVHSQEAETIDDPPAKAQFIFVEGRCLELFYVGRDYSMLDGDEAKLRLITSEDEARARREMKLRTQMHGLAQEPDKKGNH